MVTPHSKTNTNFVWRIIILFLYVILGVVFQYKMDSNVATIWVLGFFLLFLWVVLGILKADDSQFTQEVQSNG